jgi:hypothetical protein
MEKETFQQSQQGSGSAESTGQERKEQWNNSADMDQQQKENIAKEIGEEKDAVIDVKDTGGLTGRDDQAGGSGDGMESQNTNQPTDI